MTVLLWVLIGCAILLVAALCLLSYALFLLVRGPIRVVDVTPDEDRVEVTPAEAMKAAGLEPDRGIQRLRPGGWPHS